MLSMIQVVGESGETIGSLEKIAAHENGGVWHRAISVFLFNPDGQLLIQRRAGGKYHFAGLWANSCCSHPTVDETVFEAAKRAMSCELGVDAELTEVAVVRYEAYDLVSGHTEREHDHILVGHLNSEPSPNPLEVEETKWISIDDLKSQIVQQPESFAPWLPIILSEVSEFTR